MTATKEAITITTADLARAVQSAAQFAAKKSPKEALLCVKLQVTDNGLEVTATDGAMAARFPLTSPDLAESFAPDERPTLCLPADHLSNLLSKVTAETTHLVPGDLRVTVLAGQGEFEVLGCHPDDFPDAFREVPPVVATVQASALAEALQRASIAASKEPTRFAINGIRIEIEDGKITCIGTDGRRLAIADAPCNTMQPATCVVPITAVRNIIRVLAQADGTSVGLHIDSQRVVVQTEIATVSVQLLEDRFPDWGQVVPEDCPASLNMDRALLFEAVDRVAVACGKDVPEVSLDVDDHGGLSISTESSAGSGGEAIKAEVEGEPECVTVNPAFLLDALRAADGEQVKVDLVDGKSPMLWGLGDGFRYVLVPITGG
ncbi:MAG: DNA polymerase III subunit beta [Planctomycetota bacterium]